MTRKRKTAAVGLLAGAAWLGLSLFSVAQQGESSTDEPRSIKSEDFARNRPVGAAASAAGRPGASDRPRPRYRRKIADAVGSEAKSSSGAASGAGGKAVKTGQAASPQLLGLTLWRLRELRAGESAANAVKVQNADQSGWHWRVPERSSFARPIAVGDIVRLTVEAEREGYLYIINRELRRDGSMGEPVLLFPESAAVNNFVRPGEVVDIPDRLEDWPYFRIVSSDPNYAGEALWVILSLRRINGWKTAANHVIGNCDLMVTLERQASPGELYELESGEGEAETLEEIAATGGNQRRNSERSLEIGAVTERRLKRDGPLPQSVYEAAVEAGAVIVVPVRLRCKK